MRRGSPFGLVTTCILACHVVGVPIGTFSITPRRSSSSSCCFTFSRRWTGTGRAPQSGLGSASGSMWILKGLHDIIGSRWWPHLLNVEDLYLSSKYAFILGTFSSTGSNGSRSGNGGGGVRGLHPPGHVVFISASTPPARLCRSTLLPHSELKDGDSVDPAATMLGKFSSRMPRALMTSLLMNRSLTPSATRTCAAVSTVLPETGSVPAILRINAPITLRLVPLMEIDWLLIRQRSDFLRPSLYRTFGPVRHAWHPLSATASMLVGFTYLKAILNVSASSRTVYTDNLTRPWSSRRVTHPRRLSYDIAGIVSVVADIFIGSS